MAQGLAVANVSLRTDKDQNLTVLLSQPPTVPWLISFLVDNTVFLGTVFC